MAPITAPMRNGSTVPRITSRHMIMVRVMPEPSITTVCTGSSTAGGIASAIMPSSTTPPAAPVKTPRKDVTSDAAVRPRKVSASTPGVPRKSMRFFAADVRCKRKVAGRRQPVDTSS